jgi:hypothetical protein
MLIPDLAGSTELPPDSDITPESDVEEPDEDPQPPDPQADELDGLRIRQLAQGRRAIYRSRSYALIAALVCLVAAVQLCLNAARRLLHHIPGIRPYAYLCFALAFLMAFLFFLRRTIELHRELNQPHPDHSPPSEPDFSPLSDGSQRWEKLDHIE